MKKLILYISAGIFCGLLACPAEAQEHGGFKINSKALPDASNIERARLRLQVVDTSPILTDNRPKNQQPDNYIINVAPQQSTPGNTFVINSPTGSGGGYVNLNGLAPVSDMQRSNISHRQIAPSNLPQGSSTGVHGPTGAAAGQTTAQNSLAGRMTTPIKSHQMQAASIPAKGYGDYHSGGQSAGGPSAQGSVHGEIKNQPNILKNRVLK